MKPATTALVLLLAAVLPAGAVAAPPAQAAREIDQLILALGGSGCEFQRNGSWYGARKAEAHLRRKYDYLRERDMVESAEQFIERAATRSSMSGRDYEVRCPGRPATASAAWLQARLAELRRRSPAPP